MKFTKLNITSHAKQRWKERVRRPLDEIESLLKQARVLDKNEPVPYPKIRHPDTTVAVFEDICFFLDNDEERHEYCLITVFGKYLYQKQDISNNKDSLIERKKQLENDIRFYNKDSDERALIVAEMQSIEIKLALLKTTDTNDSVNTFLLKQILKELRDISSLIKEMKNEFAKQY